MPAAINTAPVAANNIVVASANPSMRVDHVRQELLTQLPLYDLIRDCLGGEISVKRNAIRYLPMPNASDTSTKNIARYRAYVERAIFYNVTNRTREGLAGQIFAKEPNIKNPPELDTLITDANGAGVGILQLAKKAVDDVLALGRSGLFVDYPANQGAVSKQDLVDGIIRPTITVYDPESIINWRTVVRGAQKILSMVILSETYMDESDPYKENVQRQFRELRLDENGEYYVQIWRPVNLGSSSYSWFGPKVYPLDAQGARMREIAFTFIGSVDNDEGFDPAPLGDMAHLNVGHFRNSADYEEASFIVGQPTLFVAGLTVDWYEQTLEGHIPFGSRAGVPLPENAVPYLLQAQANTLPKEAMESKEKQMVALGAKLVETRNVARTLGEVNIETTGELSALASVATNVSLAFKWALEWAAALVGQAESSVEFALSTDFMIAKMTANERVQLLKEMQGGGITFSEYRKVMTKAGIATLEDNAARSEMEQDIVNGVGAGLLLDKTDDGDDTDTGGTSNDGVATK